ncbi:hypothetical protein BJ878DRAFT_477175 [Calycina marina]|uniref:Aminoglycoside phosphotransferase domain-containing protein n=1 Tax=Calycina marina TaxID=1763456 RepID=A0A9P7Z900_9HELO|nr:hypothetical protein BJ878DRAFT_477175 [Calycina marina]
MCLIQKEGIIGQLSGYLSELRTVKGKTIGSVDGSSSKDPLFERDKRAYRPFKNESDFNEGIIETMKPTTQNVFIEMVADMVRAMPEHDTLITHSDIAPRNILVCDGKIVAILDWEYVKALYLPDWEDTWIIERVVDKIMKPYHIEHAVTRNVREVNWLMCFFKNIAMSSIVVGTPNQ